MHNKTLIQTQHLTATYLEQCTAPSKQASHRKQGKSYSVNPITLKRDGVRQKWTEKVSERERERERERGKGR